MLGLYGRILHVDLTESTSWEEELDEDLLQTCLGGKGLGTHLLRREVDPTVNPLGPDNCFILTTGPATTELVPGGARFGAYALSPLTGGYAESYAGGSFGPALKRTGYDAVILRGEAPRAVAVVILPGGARFLEARDLWGRDALSAEEELLARGGLPDARALAIGPAGENLVRFACINTEKWRQLGRTGLGAVLGAKRVKGILADGDRVPRYADPSGLRQWRAELTAAGRENPSVQSYRKYGTPATVALTNEARCFPTRYWRRGQLENWPNIAAKRFLQVCDVRSDTCPGCFMACGKLATVREGPQRGLTIGGPEYETIYAFGGLCEIDDIPSIMRLNYVCDALGLDTISAGNAVGFAMEAHHLGNLPHEIHYGDVDGAEQLLRLTAHREGIGELFAEGTARAASELRLDDLAIHVKGMEPA
ncbi:MAG: aldehyde ferredoxin oxidoreductase N-terminal domain-containing protein, partial [Bacillota bacterium]